MDSMQKTYIERSENGLDAANILKRVSEEPELKEMFHLLANTTFYSSAISHAYYAIFYAGKAILITEGIKTESPEVHKKTFEEFKKHFVDTGVLDLNLLEIYKKMIVRADTLLEIFKDEKWKRGNFTYQTIPQANKEPAEDSMKNAKTFISNIKKVIENIHEKNKTSNA